ncbi:hypothetical protein PoB_007544300 [Plakobranchus ocellatus]|uniref:Cyclic nucleotide-binding domain-containing protein n=1 Tax=Plakobranchus ocellatus TaxID=259542 RepID=A0AAV4DXW4_9GAST|nr:hypothetical protein PoB_007544300 [Plakobranchus ocellatus]
MVEHQSQEDIITNWTRLEAVGPTPSHCFAPDNRMRALLYTGCRQKSYYYLMAGQVQILLGERNFGNILLQGYLQSVGAAWPSAF